jgi:hypothetical protein
VVVKFTSPVEPTRPFQPGLPVFQSRRQEIHIVFTERPGAGLLQQFRHGIRLAGRIEAQHGRQMGIIIENDFGRFFDLALRGESRRRIILALGIEVAVIGNFFIGRG